MPEGAGAFDDIIDSQFLPRQFCRVSFTQHFELVAVDFHHVAIKAHLAGKHAMRTIILECIGELIWTGKVINRNHIIVFT